MESPRKRFDKMIDVFQRLISYEPQVYKKLVVVGDTKCGKTELIKRMMTGKRADTAYQPTFFDSYMTEVDTGRTRVELAMWDTSGADQLEELRMTHYPDKDVVLICFNVMDPVSLESVENKWSKEVSHFCPGVPVLLVGLQTDIRMDKEAVQSLQNKGLKPVTTEIAESIRHKIGAEAYLECSSKSGKGVQEVMQTTAKLSLCRKKVKKHKLGVYCICGSIYETI